jgi:tyrosyl-tRNA synthetase
MWKYWVFLTDLKQSEVDALKAEVAEGKLHPMEAKKRLARTNTAGFHGESAAIAADENWVTGVQRREVPADVEKISTPLRELARMDAVSLQLAEADLGMEAIIDTARLIFRLGMKASRKDAERQVSAGVTINGEKTTKQWFRVGQRPCEIVVRFGKQIKIAVVQ